MCLSVYCPARTWHGVLRQCLWRTSACSARSASPSRDSRAARRGQDRERPATVLHASQPPTASAVLQTGVESINVTATVSDSTGRFVPDLRKEDDFEVRQRPVPAGHAVQRRTRAGQPRHRPRHQRQHGRREDRRKQRVALDLAFSLRTCSIPATRSSSIDSATIRRSSRDGPGAGRTLSRRSDRSNRTAARRCTTRFETRCRSRRRGPIARRPSS